MPQAHVCGLADVEDIIIFLQYELHNLVLEDHVHGDVGKLRLRSKQRRTEHDRHILYGHTIVLAVFNDPVRQTEFLIIFIY